MAIGIDTTRTFSYVLNQHRLLSETDQPKLTFRFLSCREEKKMHAIFIDSLNQTEDDDVFAKALEGIKIPLVGWDNYGQPFNADELDSIISKADILELRNNLQTEMLISELDKKKAGYASKSISANSAKETAPANV